MDAVGYTVAYGAESDHSDRQGGAALSATLRTVRCVLFCRHRLSPIAGHVSGL